MKLELHFTNNQTKFGFFFFLIVACAMMEDLGSRDLHPRRRGASPALWTTRPQVGRYKVCIMLGA